MGKIYRYMAEIDKEFLPIEYQKRLIEQKRFEELTKYIIENNIDLNMALTVRMDTTDLGKLLAQISIEKFKQILI